MNALKKYINYLKDNPEGYWFKRKIFGWGWTPATWQGWLVILAFITYLLWEGFRLSDVPNPSNQMLAWFFVRLGVAIILLIIICIKTGEKPRWQWGIPKKTNDNDSNQV